MDLLYVYRQMDQDKFVQLVVVQSMAYFVTLAVLHKIDNLFVSVALRSSTTTVVAAAIVYFRRSKK